MVEGDEPAGGIDDDGSAEYVAGLFPGALKPSVLIGSSLDALVRTTRAWVNEKTQRLVATRTAEVWRTTRPNTLTIGATVATVEDEPALQANDQDGRWLLPAFMAGMRQIKPRRGVVAEDFIALVGELLALKPTADSIEYFHDWLCADGAEGFEVLVDRSFSEVLEEAVNDTERQVQRVLAVRHEPIAAFGGVTVAARDLDAAALRKEFDIPLGLHAKKQQQHSYQMAEGEVTTLSTRVDDPNDWTTVELETVLAMPQMRSMVSPARVARRIVGRLAVAPDASLLRLIAQLQRGDDPFTDAIAAALRTPEVGATIGREIAVGDKVAVEALGGYLCWAEAGAVASTLSGLLARASDDAEAFEALCWLAKSYGVPRLRAWLDLGTLQDASATILGRLLDQCSAPLSSGVEIVDQLNPPLALAFLKGLAADDLSGFSHVLRRHLERGSKGVVEGLADLVLATPNPAALETLGTLLLKGRFNDWTGRRLYGVCAALMRVGRGEKFLLPLARNNNTAVTVRLIAMETLAPNTELLARLCERQVGDLLAPPEVQRRLKELRDELKKRGKQ